LGLRPSSLQRELSSLEGAGILKSRQDRGRRYYFVEKSLPIFEELRSLMMKTTGLVDLLRDALKSVASKIEAAFVYGSVAQGRERHDSDIDLMVIGDVGFIELSPILDEVEQKLRREVNPSVFTRKEFLRRIDASDSFVASVLAKPTLPVIGRVDDITGGGSGRRPNSQGRHRPN
jgi:predicted nucleotidyltransferase